MNTTIPVILPGGVATIRQITSVGPLIPVATTSISGVTDVASSVVELSRLGQFLSSVSEYQKAIARLQATQGGGQNPNADFESLQAATERFVEAFNTMQKNGIADLQIPINAMSGDSLSDQFSQVLKQATTALYSNGTSELTKLSDIGISFQASSVAGSPGGLSIDEAALKSAFTSDRAGTISLLSQASSAFAQLGDTFARLLNALSAETGGTLPLEGGAQGGLDLAAILGADTSLIGAGFSAESAALQGALVSAALSPPLPESEEAAAADILQEEGQEVAVTGPVPARRARATAAGARAAIVAPEETAAEAPRGRTVQGRRAPAPGTSVAEILAEASAAQAFGALRAAGDIDTAETASLGAPAEPAALATGEAGIPAAPFQSGEEQAAVPRRNAVEGMNLPETKAATTTGTRRAETAAPAGINPAVIRNAAAEASASVASRRTPTEENVAIPTEAGTTAAQDIRDLRGDLRNAPAPSAAAPEETVTTTDDTRPRQVTIERVNTSRSFAQDPSVIAAIAAYHLNEGMFVPLTNPAHERVPGGKKEAVPVVEPVIRVKPVQKVRP